jgi:hypothetical protein
MAPGVAVRRRTGVVPVLVPPLREAPLVLRPPESVQEQDHLAVGAPLRRDVRLDLEEPVLGPQERHCSITWSTTGRACSRTRIVVSERIRF